MRWPSARWVSTAVPASARTLRCAPDAVMVGTTGWPDSVATWRASVDRQHVLEHSAWRDARRYDLPLRPVMREWSTAVEPARESVV